MKNNLQILLLVIALTGMFQFIHEAGHVIVASAYGSQSVWGFSSVIQMWDEAPQNPSEWQQITLPVGNTGWVKFDPPANDFEQILFDSMGPIFSLSIFLMFFVANFFANSDKQRKILLIGIFSLGFTLGFYYLRAHDNSWGDEKSLAYTLNVSIYLFNAPLTLIYFAGMVYAIVYLRRLNFKISQFLIVIITTIGTGITMNRSHGIVTQQVDFGNILFDPILGFSTPVFIFFLICFIVFAYIWKNESIILSSNSTD